jgi:hypothetical protein
MDPSDVVEVWTQARRMDLSLSVPREENDVRMAEHACVE